MALIKCPECGEKVSDRATVCIHCGFPLKEELGLNKAENLVKEDLDPDFNISVPSKLGKARNIVDEFIVKFNDQLEGDSSALKSKLYPIIRSIQDQISSSSDKDKLEVNDSIAKMMLDASKAVYERKKYADAYYSDLFSLVAFSDVSEKEMQQIIDFILTDVGECSERPDEYTSFWYPIEQILKFGTTEQKERVERFLCGSYKIDGGGTLNKAQVINRRPGYDIMVSKYSKSFTSIMDPDTDKQKKDPALIEAERAAERKKSIRNAIIAIAAVVGGIIVLIAVFEYSQHSYTRAQKAAQQAYSDYQREKSTLDELEREKSAVDAAIDALESNK